MYELVCVCMGDHLAEEKPKCVLLNYLKRPKRLNRENDTAKRKRWRGEWLNIGYTHKNGECLIILVHFSFLDLVCMRACVFVCVCWSFYFVSYFYHRHPGWVNYLNTRYVAGSQKL